MTPLSEEPIRIWPRLAPFAGTTVLAFVLVFFTAAVNGAEFAGAVAVCALVVAVAFGVPWVRVPYGLRVVPPMIFLLSALLLRDAAGGVSSGVGVLALLPVFWVALHGRTQELAIVLAGTAVYYLVPIIAIGGTAYPTTGYRTAVLFVAVSAIIGSTVQRLVEDGRRGARRIARHSEDLQRVAAITRRLATSSSARVDVCVAACELSSSTFACLLEPDGHGALVSTAMAGLDISQVTAPRADARPPVLVAFDSKRPVFIADADTDSSIDRALWAGHGSPASMLFEPVLRDGAAVAVLVLGWAEAVQADSKTAIVSLLATEAAIAIDRADLVEQLTDQASTDSLTGVLNRRAWDAHLARAFEDPSLTPICIALLDLDNFKAFNDTYGHQSGDRLLRAATAAWRAELRPGDVLARYGGEEFAVLLPRCSLNDAEVVIDRLRSKTPSDQTCSAGIAHWDGGESYRTLMQRTDTALYAAKDAGRDRSIAV